MLAITCALSMSYTMDASSLMPSACALQRAPRCGAAYRLRLVALEPLIVPEAPLVAAEEVMPTMPTTVAPSAPSIHWLQALRGGYQTQRERAADLLRRYGGAYLLCSISLSACSFTLFYLLVSGGVDVAAVMQRVGLGLTSARTERLGTVGLAYLLHKAASPIRFAPTMALTVMVARHFESWRARGVESVPSKPSA
jgi:hypothetical protein